MLQIKTGFHVLAMALLAFLRDDGNIEKMCKEFDSQGFSQQLRIAA
jgi:prephenate dehydrogenase